MLTFTANLFAQLGNHDNGRVASRLGVDLSDALNMVSLLLPGTAITYYGEELGEESARLLGRSALSKRMSKYECSVKKRV